MNNHSAVPQFDWVNPLKGFALLAIMLNHLVEEFGMGPWFTNPGDSWPSLAERLGGIFPHEFSFPVSLIQFLGWLGDSGPGVFIFISGFGLAWAALNRPTEALGLRNFYTSRLLRIFPLYITIHALVLAASLAIPGSDYTLASPYTFLSLLGLRFNDSLFFAFNPSWWFIWLILQLYIVFPLLFWAMQRYGMARFLLAALMFTFAVRFLGLEGVRYSQSLYYWMTGIFFGTRLAEFAAGMALARGLLQADQGLLEKFFKGGRILGVSAVTYAIGLGCSFFWYSTIVSNLLVTLGMTGLFYCLWRGVAQQRYLPAMITWIGTQAYGIYLLHQTPLMWTGSLLDSWFHLTAAVAVLAVSIPSGWLISRVVDAVLENRQKVSEMYPAKLIAWVGGIGVLLAVTVVEPMLWDAWKQRAFSMILGGSAVLILFADLVRGHKAAVMEIGVRWGAILAAFLSLFVLPERYGLMAGCLGAAFALLIVLLHPVISSKPKTIAMSGAALASLVLILEILLTALFPLEAGRWGEFPALQPHPTRVYGLRPNLAVRLRYNNYDYTLRTNSLGLPGPEIQSSQVSGERSPIPGEVPRARRLSSRADAYESSQAAELKPAGSDRGLQAASLGGGSKEVHGRDRESAIRILVVGDAFSMPEGVEYDKAYPSLLEDKLNTGMNRRRVEVVNAGVTGYGPVEQYPQIKELLPELAPDFVVYQFFVNEFKEAHIKPQERLESIGFASGEEAIVRKLLKTSQLNAHWERLGIRVREMISGRPSEERYYKSLLQFYEVGENEIYSRDRLRTVQGYLRKMQAECKRHGAEMVIYYVPASVEVSDPEQIAYFPWDRDISDSSQYDLRRPWKNLEELAGSIGMPVVDLTPHLKRCPDQPVYFPKSWHWNEKGHEIVGAAIEEDIVKNRIPSLQKVESKSPET